jgi:hypothetical protein
MAQATLTITSKNYSSWSLRGSLLARFSGLDFVEKIVSADDTGVRAELLLLSSSILVPCLEHNGMSVWDTLGDRRISRRDQAGFRPPPGRSRDAHTLPFDLRRDAFRLHGAALVAPDEPQGAFSGLQGLVAGAGRYRPHNGDLERLPLGPWRPVPV